MHTLAKRNKRFFVDLDGVEIYTPRDFLRPHLNGRTLLLQLVSDLNEGMPFIKAVVKFETACRPKG
tara:strand:+ start:523 stop:720 length:198 start_codon:yes stop_codon:yes gene_type:complete